MSDEDTSPTIVDLQRHVAEENLGMIRQLELLGRSVDRYMLLESVVETFADVIFDDDPEQKQAFATAVDIRIHHKLAALIAAAGGHAA